MAHADAVVAQDGHRQIILRDIVDIGAQAAFALFVESGEEGIHRIRLAQQFLAGPNRAAVILAHEIAVQFDDGQEVGVVCLVERRVVVVVQLRRRAGGQTIEHQRSAEPPAHHRLHFLHLRAGALLVLGARGDAEHDDDNQHRQAIGEDVHQRHPGEIGHAAGHYGAPSVYSRM